MKQRGLMLKEFAYIIAAFMMIILVFGVLSGPVHDILGAAESAMPSEHTGIFDNIDLVYLILPVAVVVLLFIWLFVRAGRKEYETQTGVRIIMAAVLETICGGICLD